MAQSEADSKQSILKRFRPETTVPAKVWGPAVGVCVVAFAVAWTFVKPAPPGRVIIATGHEDGAYHAFAERYAEQFKQNGIELEIRTTAGSVQNYELLRTREVSLAIVQGGTAPWSDPSRSPVTALASVYLEPVWVFHRRDLAVHHLGDLAGKRIAIGAQGSGTRALTLRLLAANGVGDGTGDKSELEDGTKLLPMNPAQARNALQNDWADAAFIVSGPRSPIIADLLSSDELALMSFDRSEAYARTLPYLSSVTLPRGVVDLAADLPSRDVHLLAPAAILVAHDDIHSALVPLTLQIAEQVHERGDLVNPPDTFPSKRFAEQPLHPEARRYLNYGPSFLQRYLPFWGANLIDRMKVMLLPLVTLMIPLAKFLPPVYRWRIRSRIYRWYRVLRAMDQRLREAQLTDVSAERKMLAEMERELGEEWVPLSYMEEFYNLRMHIDLVKRRVDEYHARDADRSEP